jgi:hypothetical protein
MSAVLENLLSTSKVLKRHHFESQGQLASCMRDLLLAKMHFHQVIAGKLEESLVNRDLLDFAE